MIGENDMTLRLNRDYALDNLRFFLIFAVFVHMLEICALLVILGNRVCSKAICYGCFSWVERLSR